MNKNERVIWEWVIECRPTAINVKWSLYSGGYFKIDKNINVELSDVDWKKTKPLTDSSESTFEGTFSENSDTPVMEGVLHLINGKKYNVGLCIESTELLNEILDYMHEKLQQ